MLDTSSHSLDAEFCRSRGLMCVYVQLFASHMQYACGRFKKLGIFLRRMQSPHFCATNLHKVRTNTCAKVLEDVALVA